MALPADFDRELWLDPLTFQGLVGSACCDGYYTDLFREDGFAKPIAELMEMPKARKYIERKGITLPLGLTP
jgi:hypothetical protein